MYTIENKPMKKDLLQKSPTGINGFDEITGGGLPKGRPTLVCGDAGCGKTLFAMEFLYKGATEFNEPGVFMSFEEQEKELITNMSSLGFDLQDLIHRKLLLLEYVHVERSEIEESGEFDLEGLFVRLNLAIETIGAKRVVLDTIETLFGGLPNETILRAELRRLFRWLKDKGVTAIITGERGNGSLTRYGIEEYVSDCVIMLDHRLFNQASTRRLRIIKYRGSGHGTNEYPFIIDSDGFSVLPITSLGLNHEVSSERISSGIPALDKMLGGKGFFRGSSVLLSGTAGTGKSSIAAHFSSVSCSKGERVLYFAFEESPKQIIRNMRSIGIDLEPWEKEGLLQFHTTRPTFYGLEMHLTTMIKEIKKFGPSVVIADPINSFVAGENQLDARNLSIRLIDYLKSNQITGLFTNLAMEDDLEKTNVFISSIIDTWIYLRDIELAGERNRGIYILKSRGMAHSNQIREFLLTDKGIRFEEVYIGMEGVLTGSARVAQEAREKASFDTFIREIERKQLTLEHKRKAIEAQVSLLRAEFEAEEAEIMNAIKNEKMRKKKMLQEMEQMKLSRRIE
jgi:circadian clock protein KaiC